MQAVTNKVTENDYLDLLDISTAFGEEEDNQLFQWVRHHHLNDENENPNPRMFEKQALMLNEFYLKKLIVKVSVKTLKTHFNPLSLLDPLSIQVLNIVDDLVLLVLLLQAMMAQEERRPIMVVILEMMLGIMHINNKVNIHRVHLLVKMISHMLHEMKATGLLELVQVFEPLEHHIEVDKEG